MVSFATADVPDGKGSDGIPETQASAATAAATATNPFADSPSGAGGSNNGGEDSTSADRVVGSGGGADIVGGMAMERAQRRREEAVQRLVGDVTRSAASSAPRPLDVMGGGDDEADELGVGGGPSSSSGLQSSALGGRNVLHDELLLSGTVAAAIESRLDRELHNELVKQARESAGIIGQICKDHSDAFLGSVGRVKALGGPCWEIRGSIEEVCEARDPCRIHGIFPSCDAMAATAHTFLHDTSLFILNRR